MKFLHSPWNFNKAEYPTTLLGVNIENITHLYKCKMFFFPLTIIILISFDGKEITKATNELIHPKIFWWGTHQWSSASPHQRLTIVKDLFSILQHTSSLQKDFQGVETNVNLTWYKRWKIWEYQSDFLVKKKRDTKALTNKKTSFAV